MSMLFSLMMEVAAASASPSEVTLDNASYLILNTSMHALGFSGLLGERLVIAKAGVNWRLAGATGGGLRGMEETDASPGCNTWGLAQCQPEE